MIIFTNASKQGWVAQGNGIITGGRWYSDESRQHINIFELKIAFLAIQSFLKPLRKMPQHVGLQMNNSAAVSYVNKRGGTRPSTLAPLAVEIWNICQQKGIWITAEHLPGVQNVDADWASRHFNERTEWTLSKEIFTRSEESITLHKSTCLPPSELSTTSLCFLTPRPVCHGSRRNNVTVGKVDIVHSCANRQVASYRKENTNLPSHCSKLARPAVVPVSFRDVGQYFVHFPNVGKESLPALRPGSTTPLVENIKGSGMASFREHCRACRRPSMTSLPHPYGILERRNKKAI